MKTATSSPSKQLEREYGIHSVRISTPIPYIRVNIYFVEKPVPTLIDAPPEGKLFLDQLNAALKGFGYSARDIRRIIVTHPHFDHYGLARTLSDRNGAEVWISQGGAGWIEDYEKELRKEDTFRRMLLKKAGAAASEIERVIGFYGIARRFAQSVRPSRTLSEGDTFDLASLPFTVTEVPGHTPWCILVHDVSNTMAFTGDFLPPDIASSALIQWPDVKSKDYRTLESYIASLKKVRRMKLKIALPGHGKIIRDPVKKIDDFLSLIDRRRAAVRRILKKGNMTPLQITHELFPSLPPEGLFRAVSDVMAHLEMLEKDGLVERRGAHPLYFAAH
jgi:glyoxylase-like metal-dependent hydrolase (beta-lactamase superfamily II)